MVYLSKHNQRAQVILGKQKVTTDKRGSVIPKSPVVKSGKQLNIFTNNNLPKNNKPVAISQTLKH